MNEDEDNILAANTSGKTFVMKFLG